MSEQPVVRVSTPADLASAVPYLVGYRPSDEQFVVAGLAGGTVAVMACASWEPSFDDVDGAWSRTALKGGVVYITDAMEPAEPDSYIVLGYGPQARDRALLVGGQIEELTGQHVWQISVEPDGVVARFEPQDMDWSTYPIVPDKVEAELVYMGIPAPTQTRDEMIERFTPYPEPRWEPLPLPEQLRIEESLPSARAAEAVQLMADLKAPGPGQDPLAQGRLAHLMRSSKDVRDAVLVDAVDNVSGATLLELYRGAPAEYRDVTAAVASVTMYIEEGKNIGAAEIISHVSPTSDQGALADMMTSAVDGGLPPRVLREVMTYDTTPTLQTADSRFLTERTQQALAQAQDSLARPAPQQAPQPELAPKPAVQRGPGVGL
jgi:hypothetical protein